MTGQTVDHRTHRVVEFVESMPVLTGQRGKSLGQR
jgi:hypothetical protein